MKKTILFLAIFFLGGVVLTGCGQTTEPNNKTTEGEKIKIAATIFPLYDIVKQVGGDKIEAILILPPGSSPHTFEVSPSQIKNLQNTKLFFMIGAGVDGWTKNITNTVGNTKLVNLEKNINLQLFEHEDHENNEETGDEHGHDEFDPHYWLSPDNAKIMAKKIAVELSLLDTENKNYYKTQSQSFINKLVKKDVEWQNKINNITKKDLVVFHDAWGYFANHFSLNIVATFEPFPGKIPSPQYLINLQEKVREYNINTLFIEPQLSQEATVTLAKDLGVTVAILDPLGGVTGRESYIDLIDFNVNSICQLLK